MYYKQKPISTWTRWEVEMFISDHIIAIAIIFILALLALGFVGCRIDYNTGSANTYNAEVVDMAYTPRKSSSGTGIGVTGDGDVAVVAVSSSSSSKWEVVIRKDNGSVDTIKVPGEFYYNTNVGDILRCTEQVGGKTGYIYDRQCIVVERKNQ